MIYIPNYDSTSQKCYVVQNEEVIREYERQPEYNFTIAYRDFYIRSDYIYKDGFQTFGTYSTLPVCLSSDSLTNDYWYRQDISSVLVMFLIINIFAIFLPIKLFSKIMKKGSL